MAITAGLAVRRYGSGMPWLQLGLRHHLPTCLLVALLHQAANSSLGITHRVVLLIESAAFLSASVMMYKHALQKWDQIPHPTWEGFPIFWRAGPEHAAAAFSEWLKHLRWEMGFQWGEAMETTEHRYGNAADLLGSEGMLGTYTESNSFEK